MDGKEERKEGRKAPSGMCPVRCFCGAEIQSKYSVYCSKIRSGKTVLEALNSCGLGDKSPFAPPIGSADSFVSPPSICCRAMMMANSDLVDEHNLLQAVVRWAEGDAAVGTSSSAATAAAAAAAVLTKQTTSQPRRVTFSDQ